MDRTESLGDLEQTPLANAPVDLLVEWRSKTVTTDPPHYPEHLEWWLAIKFVATSPVHMAVFLDHGSTSAWGLQPGPATIEATVTGDFFPHKWSSSDDVQVNFGSQRLTVNNGLLKRDPRELVTVLPPSIAETGALIELAEIRAHGIRLAALLIGERDTERRRLGRWRIRPGLVPGLPARFVPLATGRQSGTYFLDTRG